MKKIFIAILIAILLIFPSNTYAYTYAPVDITTLDIRALQDSVDKGYLTYELITRLYLDRIEALDDDHNAIISVNEKAIEEAKEKDTYYKEHGRTSLLFGIPIIVKDNIDVLGLPTTVGAKSLSDNYPNEDALVIKNLKDKGAIILAKANMSEFAFMASSSTSSYGTVKNAYNTSYSSYGSSGGSAVSVSLKYAPLAIGTDTNMSVRVPSSANGVIGFRPTLNKLSLNGVVGYDMTRDTVGAISSNVYDNALLMSALEGKDDNIYTSLLEDNPTNITLGVIDDFLYGNTTGIYGTEKTYSPLVELFDETLKKLEEKNIKIVHIKDFYDNKYDEVDNATLGGWTMCYSFNKYIKNTKSKIKSFQELTMDNGHIYSLYNYSNDCKRNISDIDKYENKKKNYNTYIEELYKKYNLDALVYPTTKNRLLKVGEEGFTSPSYAISPILGLPSVSMPLGFIDNLPYGIEFVTKKDNEQRLYQIINKYEQISNVYKLSDNAKNLYEIPESVENLKKLYEENLNKTIMYIIPTKQIKEYKKTYQEVLSFFENYQDYKTEEEIEKDAKQLFISYEDSLKNVNESNELFLIEIAIVLILILILSIAIRKYKKIKRKRRRKRKY